MKRSKHVKSNCPISSHLPTPSIPVLIFPPQSHVNQFLLKPSWSWSCTRNIFQIGWKPFQMVITSYPFLSPNLPKNVQLFPIPCQPPVLSIWDVRALFKVKYLLFWTGDLWKVLCVWFRVAYLLRIVIGCDLARISDLKYGLLKPTIP